MNDNESTMEGILTAQMKELEYQIKCSKESIERNQAAIQQNQMILASAKKQLEEEPERQLRIKKLQSITETVYKGFIQKGIDEDDITEISNHLDTLVRKYWRDRRYG